MRFGGHNSICSCIRWLSSGRSSFMHHRCSGIPLPLPDLQIHGSSGHCYCNAFWTMTLGLKDTGEFTEWGVNCMQQSMSQNFLGVLQMMRGKGCSRILWSDLHRKHLFINFFVRFMNYWVCLTASCFLSPSVHLTWIDRLEGHVLSSHCFCSRVLFFNEFWKALWPNLSLTVLNLWLWPHWGSTVPFPRVA